MTKSASGAATGRRAKAQRVCIKCLLAYATKIKRCACGGEITRFASLAELRRYSELRMMERAGEIYNLKAHPKYDLIVRPNDPRAEEGTKVGTYTPDFRYVVADPSQGAVTVLEEIKPGKILKSKRNYGKKVPIVTGDATLRIKLFEALYGKKVRIIC